MQAQPFGLVNGLRRESTAKIDRLRPAIRARSNSNSQCLVVQQSGRNVEDKARSRRPTLIGAAARLHHRGPPQIRCLSNPILEASTPAIADPVPAQNRRAIFAAQHGTSSRSAADHATPQSPPPSCALHLRRSSGAIVCVLSRAHWRRGLGPGSSYGVLPVSSRGGAWCDRRHCHKLLPCCLHSATPCHHCASEGG